MDSGRACNLLALSDLHLGCDLKLSTPFGDPCRAALGDALTRFLDQHTARRERGKPWRLLLAGDIFDFVAITAVPGDAMNVPFQVHDDERVYGLSPDEAKCVWKVRRVAARHEDVFHALARFVVAGNSVCFIRGNHDAELHFESVQRELKRLLARRAGVEGESLFAFEGRIEFHAWFYLEPGVLYLEHGNAHDRYCLQSGFFDETAKTEAELELPISSKVIRFFANRWASKPEDLDGADAMTFVQYIAWTFRMGNPLSIVFDYFAMVAKVMQPIARETVRFWKRPFDPQNKLASQRAQEERLARVQAWLRRFCSPREEKSVDARAEQLLAAASRPADQSLFHAAQLFYVDRMLLALAAVAFGVASIAIAHGWMKLLGCGAVALFFWAGNALLARQRRCDAHLLLTVAAERVAQIFQVKFVVMGHSHVRVDEEVIPGTRYLNMGAWSNNGEGLPHLAVIGDHAELRFYESGASTSALPSPESSSAMPSSGVSSTMGTTRGWMSGPCQPTS